MNRSGMPWILVVLALLGWQVGGSSGGGTAPKPAAAPNATLGPSAPATPPPAGATAQVEWPELQKQLEAYFGRKARSAKPVDLVRLARQAEYRSPDAYIALVPDPLDSFLPARFDQALAGIQEGFAEAEFLLDRVELPWTLEAAPKPDPKSFREKPGILLFRRPGKPGNGRLAIVFLVGETVKQGIHKQAFELALKTAQGFAAGRETERIRILGPTFSGSRESLRLAFDAWHEEAAPRVRLPQVWLVSGSATSPALDDCTFDCGRGILFSRTVMDDGKLLEQGQDYLVGQLGWNPDRIALLTESDTGYGRGATAPSPGTSTAPKDASPCGPAEQNSTSKPVSPAPPLVLKFPSGLSGLRKASEEAERGRRTQGKETPQRGPSTLAISLADESRPVDVVPEFSRLTTPTKDMALSNLLSVLCGEGKSYLGLIATDTRDRIFLAERMREICPDTQLFLLDSDLLLAHPQHREALDGAIILSSSPLFTRGISWLEPRSSKHEAPHVRQFQSELHEGVVEAIAALIADTEDPVRDRPTPPSGANAWISAIGNGSIWPLAQLPVPPERTCATVDATGYKANAVAISCLFALIALSFWLVRVARPLRQNIPGLPRALRRRGPFLLALATIQISWGVLLVVGGLPIWAFGKKWAEQESMTHAALDGGILLALVGLGAFLLRNLLPRRLPNVLALGTALRWIAILCTTVAAGGLLAEPLLHGWMAGGVELFHFRARKFTGGMSPIVSLAWIGGGYFLWSIIEMKRRTLVAFQCSAFPIPKMTPEDPILPGCRKIARKLERRMTESSPTWPFWAVLALPLLSSGIYLFRFVQPVAEARAYGLVFVGLAIGLFVLALISFQRFLRLWAELTGLLDRIEMLDLGSTFEELKKGIDWRPMKSFAWVIPPFKMTELSIAKLEPIVGAPAPAELRRLLAVALEGNCIGDPRGEAAGRQALQVHFDAALENAGGWLTPGPLQTFAVVRLIAYIRTVFAHLRGSLLGAMVPGFLLLLAVSTYEIQPKRLLFLSIWSALAAFVLMTIWAFVHMDRNPTLSAIGGTTAGEANVLDRSFVQSVLTYGILPLLGLVATRFPQIERLLSGYLNPLMRFVNGGGG